MKSLETISNEITVLEAERDFGDITPEGLETLAVLNLCYDLLSRTSEAQAIKVPTPPEMLEPFPELVEGDDDETNVYGVSSSQLADFAFALATRQGTVNLRALLREAMYGHKQKEIAVRVNLRSATISDYINNKKAMSTNNFETIINACINK